MPRRRPASGPGLTVILEEIRAEYRATREPIEALGVALEQRIDRLDRATRERHAVLLEAIRGISADRGAGGGPGEARRLASPW